MWFFNLLLCHLFWSAPLFKRRKLQQRILQLNRAGDGPVVRVEEVELGRGFVYELTPLGGTLDDRMSAVQRILGAH